MLYADAETRQPQTANGQTKRPGICHLHFSFNYSPRTNFELSFDLFINPASILEGVGRRVKKGPLTSCLHA